MVLTRMVSEFTIGTFLNAPPICVIQTSHLQAADRESYHDADMAAWSLLPLTTSLTKRVFAGTGLKVFMMKD